MTEAMIRTVSSLVNTSVDDCRVSCQHIHDLETLEMALKESVVRQHVSRAKVIMTRIRQLKKARTP